MHSSKPQSALHFLLIIILTATTSARATEIKLVGPRFAIAHEREGQRRPYGVFNPFSNQFLVTWDSKHSVRGRFINLNGTRSGVKQFFEGSRRFNGGLLFNDVRRTYILLYYTVIRPVFHVLSSNGTTLQRRTAPYVLWIVHNPSTDKILAGGNGNSVSLLDGQGTLIKQLRYPYSPNSSVDYAITETNTARFFVIVQSTHTLAAHLFQVDSITERFVGPRIRINGIRSDEAVRLVHYNPITKEITLVVGNQNNELSILRIDSFAKTLGRIKVGVVADGSVSILQIKNNLLISYNRVGQTYGRLLNGAGHPLTPETSLAHVGVIGQESQFGLVYSSKADRGLFFWEFIPDPREAHIRSILGQFFRVN